MAGKQNTIVPTTSTPEKEDPEVAGDNWEDPPVGKRCMDDDERRFPKDTVFPVAVFQTYVGTKSQTGRVVESYLYPSDARY
jgi:hypothetical protein